MQIQTFVFHSSKIVFYYYKLSFDTELGLQNTRWEKHQAAFYK